MLFAERAEVLALSTDPAHSLGDAFDVSLSADPREISPSLFALEVDAHRALERWLGLKKSALRIAAERGTYLDRAEIDELLSQSLPGVDELIGMVEVSRAGREQGAAAVIVDAAPTGHTVRLLEMPESLARMGKVFDAMLDKHRFLAEAIGRGYQPDAVDRMIASIEEEARALQALMRDPERCRMTWVLIPEVLAVEETRDAIAAMGRLGITVDELIINRVTKIGPDACAACLERARAERAALEPVLELIDGRVVRALPVLPREPRGVAALRALARVYEKPPLDLEAMLVKYSAPQFGDHLAADSSRPASLRLLARHTSIASSASLAGRAPRRPYGHQLAGRCTTSAPDAPASVSAPATPSPEIVEVLAPASARLIITGGKGGVGKTTVASAIALAAAERAPDQRVLVLSIDPAHSLGDAFGVPLGDQPATIPGAPSNLFARELDAPASFAAKRERYRAAVEEMFEKLRGSSRFDIAYDRAVLRDLFDLAPPGIDELFAVLSVIEALFEPEGYELAIIDTAPTGHALRFLELPAEAREWVHVFMRIVLQYREVIGLGELAEELLDTARQLRELEDLLHDEEQCRFLAVTRTTELNRRETERLLASLERLGIAPGALIINATVPEGCSCLEGERKSEAEEIELLTRLAAAHDIPVFSAPRAPTPPRGVDALRALGASIVEVA